ncbi:hypothetical protein [Alkalihalobacillus trypoxylicola]|uniref:Type 4 fimbrial biogenesis protein PilX N-terminal domain-containing protein n=1 Tax=Alkalihalobacillus trypoxylicola TaxID=519424 RepID=A0A162ECT6_9BACI|nr:hypothetical protein [Alkalihalobacillus trypoxylicola]KYG32299.1 hypothetical protein AZF04_05910 [Alkalihalobacillus trypoxylicola]
MKILFNQRGVALPLLLVVITVTLLALALLFNILSTEYKGHSIRSEQIKASFAAESGIEQMISLIYQHPAQAESFCQNSFLAEVNDYQIDVSCVYLADSIKITSTAKNKEGNNLYHRQTEALIKIYKSSNQISSLEIIDWQTTRLEES